MLHIHIVRYNNLLRQDTIIKYVLEIKIKLIELNQTKRKRKSETVDTPNKLTICMHNSAFACYLICCVFYIEINTSAHKRIKSLALFTIKNNDNILERRRCVALLFSWQLIKAKHLNSWLCVSVCRCEACEESSAIGFAYSILQIISFSLWCECSQKFVIDWLKSRTKFNENISFSAKV